MLYRPGFFSKPGGDVGGEARGEGGVDALVVGVEPGHFVSVQQALFDD